MWVDLVGPAGAVAVLAAAPLSRFALGRHTGTGASSVSVHFVQREDRTRGVVGAVAEQLFRGNRRGCRRAASGSVPGVGCSGRCRAATAKERQGR